METYPISIAIFDFVPVTLFRHFIRKHDELPTRVWRDNPKVGSMSNCSACHTKADSASFDEHQVKIPGVGRKMAERMVLELKDRILKAGIGAAAEIGKTPDGPSGVEDDVLSALLNLGYREAAAQKALETAAREMPAPATLDGLLKGALKILAG